MCINVLHACMHACLYTTCISDVHKMSEAIKGSWISWNCRQMWAARCILRMSPGTLKEQYIQKKEKNLPCQILFDMHCAFITRLFIFCVYTVVPSLLL